MIIFQIELPVPDFNDWKKAFDSDPLNRKQTGVRRYHIFRAMDKPNYVIIKPGFDNLQNAEAMHEA